MRRPSLHVTRVVLALLALAVACTSDAPKGPGAIFVTASATTLEPQVFQFDVAIDAATPRKFSNVAADSFLVAGLAHGTHHVSVTGEPLGCAGGADRDVTLKGDDTAKVVVAIQCPRTSGDVNVTVATTGPNPDPDGYFAIVDNIARAQIATNGT